MILVNLTPHNVNIINAFDKCNITIQPTAPPARCEEEYIQAEDCILYTNTVADSYYPIPTGYLNYARVTGLPDPKPNTKYIVSVLVAQQFPERDDLVVPYDLVRKQGQIIGCRKLVRII
jgi:hypothetical protein